MSFVLQAPVIVLEDAVLRPGHLTISGGVIASVREGAYNPSGRTAGGEQVAGALPVVEAEGMVAAGFVDLHLHGGDGAQVNGDSPAEVVDSLETIGRFHARHGTTSFLATTVSDTPERLAATVSGAAGAFAGGGTGGSRLLGVHLEGPWIAPGRAGAQDPSKLRPPDAGELRALLTAGEGCVRMVTLAPELAGAELLMAEAFGGGLVVAIGHTEADFETARRAFDAGARHVTHLFNAMAPLHHRHPGAVTAALLDERVTLEVIADLEHVHPGVLKLAARLARGRLVAVSDAVPAAGLGPGAYRLGQRDVSVTAGRVSLAADPATLAGSTLTLDKAISNLVSAAGLTPEEAFAAASSVPGRAIALPSRVPAGGLAGAAPGGGGGDRAAVGEPVPAVPAVPGGGAPRGISALPTALGRLTAGAPADIVVLRSGLFGAGAGAGGSAGTAAGSGQLEVVATLVAGRPVWDPEGIFTGTRP